MFDNLEELMGTDSKKKLNIHLLNFYNTRKQLETLLKKIVDSVQDQDEETVELVEEEVAELRDHIYGDDPVFLGDKGLIGNPEFEDKKRQQDMQEKMKNQGRDNDVS